MQVSQRLKDTFRARDEQGNEYEVKVFVEVSTGNTTGGGTWETEGFVSPRATAVSGVFAGQSFTVNCVGGDEYQIVGVKTIKITRVR